MAIVAPVTDGGDWAGIAIFDPTVEATTAIVDGDPGVQAGIFTYELDPIRSFPGDTLPGA